MISYVAIAFSVAACLVSCAPAAQQGPETPDAPQASRGDAKQGRRSGQESAKGKSDAQAQQSERKNDVSDERGKDAASRGTQGKNAANEGQHGKGGHGKHAGKKKNHLAKETSPYLLQHVYNPVDWYPWGKEALERAKKEQKPIFLSIGYSACHWCHVMERESFEDEAIAKVLNEKFVCIKVDREERPDIDEIYMTAVVGMNNGNGGWPMSVFLTPDLKPYFGGTYYPPRAVGGRPGFNDVLRHCEELWRTKRDKVTEYADKVVEFINREAKAAGAKELDGEAIGKKVVQLAQQRFDETWGGFGVGAFAPKFPHCTELSFLLRYGVRVKNARAVEMVEKTLENMARGGIYDQVGGGFARYSVDRQWLVPHFEKMLYDNSQLASLYLEAWQATKKPFYKRIATETLDYVVKEMTSEEGGFYSTTDADSEGVEGKFFVWTKREFDEAVGADAKILGEFFGVSEQGNFEHKNVLTRRVGIVDFAKKHKLDAEDLRAKVAAARKALYAVRSTRVPPGLDDKILSSWNGLMLSAFAQGARVLGRQDWLAVAQKNAAFLLREMRREDGRLWRTRRGGRSHLDAYLEDYAAITRGLIDLFECDGDTRWMQAAQELHALVEKHFVDAKNGGYFSTADDHEKLIVRRSSASESSLPSDVGLAAHNAARLGLLAGNTELLARARKALSRHGQELDRFPNAYGQLLKLIDFFAASPKEVYVVGEPSDESTKAFLGALHSQWPPYSVYAHIDPGAREPIEMLLPAAKGKTLVDGKPAAYVCTEGTCKAPTTDASKLQLR